MFSRSSFALPSCLASRLGPVGVKSHTVVTARTALNTTASTFRPQLRLYHNTYCALLRQDFITSTTQADSFQSAAAVLEANSDDGALYQDSLPTLKTSNSLANGPRLTSEEFEYHMLSTLRLFNELAEVFEHNQDEVQLVFCEHHRFAQSFILGLSAEEFSSKWNSLTQKERASMLSSLLIGSLVDSPEQALFVLKNMEPMPRRFYWSMKSLVHIHVAHGSLVRQSPYLKRLYQQEIDRNRRPENWKHATLPVAFLDLLLQYSTPVQCEELIEAYKRVYPFHTPQSLAPVILHYVKVGNIERALQIFEELPTTIFEVSTERLTRARDELLRNDVVNRSHGGSHFALLPQILALGIEPDAALHNAVLQAAMSNNLPDVAWDLYGYLRNENLDVNSRSHYLLLKDAFHRKSMQGMNEMMTSIHQREDLANCSHLIAYTMNIARVISFYERKASPSESLSHIMALYDRAHSRRPLVALGLVESIIQPKDGFDRPPPSPIGLAFTIWCYIMIQRSEHVVTTLWTNLNARARSHRDIYHAMQYEYIYNGFVTFYARHLHTLPKATEIVLAMLDHDLCRPTMQTWTLLISACLRYDRVGEAKRLIKLMRSQGYEGEFVYQWLSKFNRQTKLEACAKLLSAELGMPTGIEEPLDETELKAEAQE